MPKYSVDMGGRTVEIETDEPFSLEEQRQAAAIKLKAQGPGPGLGETAVEIGKGMALPTIGQVGGAALGTATLGPGVGTFLGGTLGGLAGETVNQVTGVTPQSLTGLAAAGAGQGVGSLLGKTAQALKQGVRNLPGIAQFERNRILGSAADATAQATPEQGAVDAAFTAARASAAGEAAPPLGSLAGKVTEIEGQLAKTPLSQAHRNAQTAVDRLKELMANPQASMTDVVTQMDDLGRFVRQASGERADTPQLRALYGALRESIESAASTGNVASRDLLQALGMAKQRYAALQLDEVVQKAVETEARGQAGAPQQFVRGYQAIRRELAEAFPEEAIQALDRSAAKAALAPRGSTLGLGQLILGGAGFTYGGIPGAIQGVAAGAVAAGLPAALRETLHPVTVGLFGAGYQAAQTHTRQQYESGAPVSLGGLLSLPR